MMTHHIPLIPAKAGTQAFFVGVLELAIAVQTGTPKHKNTWVPAFAGMSGFGSWLGA